MTGRTTPEDLCAARAAHPDTRLRDVTEHLECGELPRVAAPGARRLAPHPDALMPHLCRVGEVMARTRTPSVVHEKTGVYDHYHSGEHACMIVNEEIDLRMFPSRWVHAFAVTEAERRSLQVFDADGALIAQMFARRNGPVDYAEPFSAILDALPDLTSEPSA